MSSVLLETIDCLAPLWAGLPLLSFPWWQKDARKIPNPIQTPKTRYSGNKEVHMNWEETMPFLKRSTVCLCSVPQFTVSLCCTYNIFTHNPTLFRNICKRCSRARKVFVSWCKQSGWWWWWWSGGGQVDNKVAIRMVGELETRRWRKEGRPGGGEKKKKRRRRRKIGRASCRERV